MDKLFNEIKDQVHDASGIKFPELTTWYQTKTFICDVWFPKDKIEIQLTENNVGSNGFDWVMTIGDLELSGSGKPGREEYYEPDTIDWDEIPEGIDWEYLQELIENTLHGKYLDKPTEISKELRMLISDTVTIPAYKLDQLVKAIDKKFSYTYREEDLHQSARDLMHRIDKKYNRSTQLSLDEYLHEVELSQLEKMEIIQLINRF